MKYLTDSQTNIHLVELLLKIEWEVETVYQHGVATEPNDAVLVRYAHEKGMVFVTFDDLKGDQGYRVTREISRNGGRLIQIAGGPQQPITRSAGKLLLHYENWHPFLESNDGSANLRDARPAKLFHRDEMNERWTRLPQEQFEEYLKARHAAKTQPITKRKQKVPKEQKGFSGGAA